MTSDRWTVVVVPFPFGDQPGHKRRPALVLSHKNFNRSGHTILSMITTASHRPWPGDVRLAEPGKAGLDVPCIVRLKNSP